MHTRSVGAVLVLPTTTTGQRGPVGSWVSTAGWAAAVARVVGASWIVTPSGLMEVEEVRRLAAGAHIRATSSSSWRARIPVVVKTAAKDVREWRRAHAFRVPPDGPWNGSELRFVWQRHELFHSAGLDLADALSVPSVLFVPATLVWQAREWGVRRPGWARLAEYQGETRILARASLVACGSELVDDEVARLGVPPHRRLVVRTGFDPELFTSCVDGASVRRRLGIDDRFVVAWVGSFRRFHGLDQLVAAMAGLSNALLLLVGDGPERSRIETLARQRDVTLICTGTVPHTELPAYLAAADAAVVLAESANQFHYSPLKLAEYLACGVPVVAPRAGTIDAQLADGVEAVLVDPGDITELASTLQWLRDHPDDRARLGREGRAAAVARWSWDRTVERVVEALGRSE